MTTQQISESAAVVERVFHELAGQWRRETSHLSDSGRMLSHPMYRALIALGYGVVPFMIEELKGDNPEHWFQALHEITGEDPVSREDWGKIKKMAAAWLEWGRQHGYPLDPARRSYLESLFPGLIGSKLEVREEPNHQYNCVAWAIGSTDHWYWPLPYAVWPGRERRQSVSAFVSLFESLEYDACVDGLVEAGYSKIVLYVRDGVPSHVARVESSGIWTSKLGKDELIAHEPDALTGVEYGTPEFFFRKKI